MLVGACCGERGTKVIWVTCIQEICYSKISGSRRLKNAHVEWLVVAFGRLMKWVKNPYKIVPLLSRSLGTSCQTKLRHWYFSPFCIAGGQGNYTFMADLFYISYMFIQMQMCVCRWVSWAEQLASHNALYLPRMHPPWLYNWGKENQWWHPDHQKYYRNPKSATPDLENWLLQWSNRSNRLNAVECGWMRLNHVECIPLKEHGDRGRHGRCLPSESKQFNSMQPSLGRDPKRQKSKKSFDVLPAVMMHRVGWWEIHGNPALSISVFMWPYHDMWWPSTANLRRGARKWMKWMWSIGSFRDRILRGSSYSSCFTLK